MTTPANLHGSHCFENGEIRCGWPEFHKCWERECTRTVRPGWAVCDEHADKWETRWERVTEEPAAVAS